MAHDIVIRGGTVVDGTGGAPCTADVAVRDGIITEIGKVAARGDREIDAGGLTVTPGFVDLHTHLDAQIFWDPDVTPLSWHGVTTALMGNCGVTFAPCKPGDREFLAAMMESVEDIPRHAMLSGMPWNWEDYGGYLDAAERARPGINVAGLVGHSAIRYGIMGERSFAETASADEVREMAALAAAAVGAGALGFSTNRHEPHKAPDGRSIPGTYAETSELVEIGRAVGSRGGMMQLVGATPDILMAIADQTRARILFSGGVGPRPGSGKAVAAWLEVLCRNRDITAIAQVRGAGAIFSLQGYLPFAGETWDRLRGMRLPDRLAAIRSPSTAASLIDEAKAGFRFRAPLESLHYLGNGVSPNYTQAMDDNVPKLMAETGESFVELFLRLSRETDGRALFKLRNFCQNLEEVAELFKSPHIYPGLGDAGAHVSLFTDAGWATFLLSYWVRERGLYSLEEGVRRLTSGPARVLGLNDRGRLSVGLRADVNVFDAARLIELQPTIVYDFPGGAPRYIQRAVGYKATLVNGRISVEDGAHTGARAGMVLRHAS